MALDPQQVEALVKLFQQKYPHWKSFSNPADPAFEQDEIHYKRRLVQKAQECLKAEDLCQLLLKREPDKIADFLTRLESLGTSSNLLFRTNPAAGDLNILYHPNLDKTALGEATLDLLYGENPSEQRLTRYLNFVVSQNLPNKWTFFTYFLFLWQPRTEIFIKPASMKRFLAFLGLGDRFSSTPTAAGYAAVKQLAHDLKAALQEYQPRDMIDIQSFIWVCTNVLDNLQSYWKISPGEEAWQWEECRQAGFIAVGWDEMGDISGLTRKQFEERHQVLLTQRPDLSEGWSKGGLKQLWQFAHQIQVGDRIVANRGKTQVLGIALSPELTTLRRLHINTSTASQSTGMTVTCVKSMNLAGNEPSSHSQRSSSIPFSVTPCPPIRIALSPPEPLNSWPSSILLPRKAFI